MKKAFMPLLVIFGVMIIFAVIVIWYEKNYGKDGPFKSTHHHGGGEEHHDEETVVRPKFNQ